MDTGLRKQESLNLVVDDIKTDELDTSILQRQNGEDRTVPLCKSRRNL